MDYSAFVQAVQNADHKTVNKYCRELFPRLRNYLIANLGAAPEDAEDAVQRMFEYVIPRIERNEIKTPEVILSYMVTATRHSYFNLLRSVREDSTEYAPDRAVTPADQIWNLVEEEKEKALLKCLSELRDHYRLLISFLFEFPDSVPQDIAEYFGISLNNVWIRKH